MQRWGRRETLTSRQVANLYDALGGRYVGMVDGDAEPIDLSHGVRLAPLIRESKVAPVLVKAYERARDVTTEAAKARHADTMVKLGIPIPCRGVVVDRVEVVSYPMWVGLVRTRDGERLVAVSGRNGRPLSVLSDALTAAASHVRSALPS